MDDLLIFEAPLERSRPQTCFLMPKDEKDKKR